MDRLVAQILRMVMRMGLRSGIGHLSRGGKRHEEMTPEERKRARSVQRNMGQATRLARMLRRFGR